MQLSPFGLRKLITSIFLFFGTSNVVANPGRLLLTYLEANIVFDSLNEKSWLGSLSWKSMTSPPCCLVSLCLIYLMKFYSFFGSDLKSALNKVVSLATSLSATAWRELTPFFSYVLIIFLEIYFGLINMIRIDYSSALFLDSSVTPGFAIKVNV